MILEQFLLLPPYIQYEGIEFVPQIINDGGNEAKLVYSICSVAADSPHKLNIEAHNCWYNNLVDADNPPAQGFLVLYEGLNNDADLVWALRDCLLWLGNKGLLK